MAKLKRDERICPLCAETIKAAASRCRFCQSDVTPQVEAPTVSRPEPQAEAQTEVQAEAQSESEPGRAVTKLRQVGFPVPQSLTMVLAILVVLAGAGVGVSWWRAEHGSATAAPGGSLVDDDARTQVLVEAADLTQRTLSYDYKTLANDMEVARARMTPSFRKQYDSTMAQVRANTVKNKITLQAVVVSTAIIKATEHQATVLVFLNQTTTAGKSKNQQLDRNSLVITLTRREGDWAMSKLTALG